MRNIIDLMDIETSIVSLYEASLLDNAISEASLLDIEGSIEYGDSINDQFEKLKAIVCNPKEYEKWPRQNWWNLYLSNDFDTLLQILLFDSSTNFFGRKIECQRYNKPTNSGGWIVVWEWSFKVDPRNSKTSKIIKIKVEDANAKMSLTKFLKTYVAPHFKDLGSFKELIENNTQDSI